MDYHLYPPFFVYPGENNFSDGWEAFCCKLLCLTKKTEKIYRRHAPDNGIDLFFPEKRIAYQCKCVESGKSGDFNVQNAIHSIESAQELKKTILRRGKNRWKTYTLCTNVDLTGKAEEKLRQIMPNIELLTKSYWQNICETYSKYVEKNFRILLDIPSPDSNGTMIQDSLSNCFPSRLSKKLKKWSFDLFLYSKSYDKVLRVPVSPDFLVSDLLEILTTFFNRPNPKEYKTENYYFRLYNSIEINGLALPHDKTLSNLGIEAGSVITYWTKTSVEEILPTTIFKGFKNNKASPVIPDKSIVRKTECSDQGMLSG